MIAHEDNTEPVRQNFHFLYIDSNEDTCSRVFKTFDSSPFAEPKILEDFRNRTRIHPNYDLIFTCYSNFEEGIYEIIHCNLDDAYPIMKRIKPINGIIFEVKTGMTKNRYKWHHFLEDLSRIGLQRLNFNNGFIAFGNRFNDETREILMRYNTRKIIKKLKTVDQLKEELTDYLNLISGSSLFQLNKSIHRNEQDLVEYVDRSIHFEDEKLQKRTLHLMRLMVNEMERYSYLVTLPDIDDFSQFR